MFSHHPPSHISFLDKVSTWTTILQKTRSLAQTGSCEFVPKEATDWDATSAQERSRINKRTVDDIKKVLAALHEEGFGIASKDAIDEKIKKEILVSHYIDAYIEKEKKSEALLKSKWSEAVDAFVKLSLPSEESSTPQLQYDSPMDGTGSLSVGECDISGNRYLVCGDWQSLNRTGDNLASHLNWYKVAKVSHDLTAVAMQALLERAVTVASPCPFLLRSTVSTDAKAKLNSSVFVKSRCSVSVLFVSVVVRVCVCVCVLNQL